MDDRRSSRPKGLLRVGSILLLAFVLLLPTVSAVGTADGTYEIPLTDFNITDHNLSYATNMVELAAVASASWTVSLRSTLSATPSGVAAVAESEVGLGPVPAGPDETNITPLLIVQEATSGMLRIEFVPYPMNDTFGSIVYQGDPVAAGPAPFLGHELGLRYVQTSPSVPPYSISLPYGRATGNLTVTWDNQTLVPPSPIAWASLGAFYAYGLHTGGFATGFVGITVTTSPATLGSPSLGFPDPRISGVPLWVVSAAVSAVVAAAVVAVVLGRRRPG